MRSCFTGDTASGGALGFYQTTVDEREKGDARGVTAQGTSPETRRLESVRLEKPQLEIVPAAFRPDGKQHALPDPLAHDRRQRPGPPRTGGAHRRNAQGSVDAADTNLPARHGAKHLEEVLRAPA